jgi:DNA-binding NarL/FixJ family response regulator
LKEGGSVAQSIFEEMNGCASFRTTSVNSIGAIRENMADPLSKRELEILNLLAQRLPTREITVRLFIAPNTVKKTPEQYLSET